jgi:hypothetical protein
MQKRTVFSWAVWGLRELELSGEPSGRVGFAEPPRRWRRRHRCQESGETPDAPAFRSGRTGDAPVEIGNGESETALHFPAWSCPQEQLSARDRQKLGHPAARRCREETEPVSFVQWRAALRRSRVRARRHDQRPPAVGSILGGNKTDAVWPSRVT